MDSQHKVPKTVYPQNDWATEVIIVVGRGSTNDRDVGDVVLDDAASVI